MILALFFTRGVSLEVWLNKGLFDREKLIYDLIGNIEIFDESFILLSW